MPHDELTIGQLARRANLRTSALRYYEERGLLHPSRRVSGRRRYGPEAWTRLSVIVAAQRSGFTLAEIKVLMSAVGRERPSARWKAMATSKLEELAQKRAELERMETLLRTGLACDCVELAGCRWLERPTVGSPPAE